jgi:hypothetical protein
MPTREARSTERGRVDVVFKFDEQETAVIAAGAALTGTLGKLVPEPSIMIAIVGSSALVAFWATTARIYGKCVQVAVYDKLSFAESRTSKAGRWSALVLAPPLVVVPGTYDPSPRAWTATSSGPEPLAA